MYTVCKVPLPDVFEYNAPGVVQVPLVTAVPIPQVGITVLCVVPELGLGLVLKRVYWFDPVVVTNGTGSPRTYIPTTQLGFVVPTGVMEVPVTPSWITDVPMPLVELWMDACDTVTSLTSWGLATWGVAKHIPKGDDVELYATSLVPQI
jgi:hypothetical protein